MKFVQAFICRPRFSAGRTKLGKLLVAAFASIVLIGSATAVFAATPAGKGIVHSITHVQSSTAAKKDVSSHKNNGHDVTSHGNSCPGLPEAQQLASKYSLSTDSKSSAIQAICALHQGTFKGTTSRGASVSSRRVFGYGESDMLLAYASYLATHNKTSASSKLTSDNLLSYLAQALKSCGAMPLGTCLKTNTPAFQPGKNNGNGNSGSHGNGSGTGNSGNHDNGKPTSTPTPPPHH
ncbi:MAG: hypothetical protein E6J11_14750 [Chloroflexi bacterium]|nr:MAG: hypothetical protein E6J11_14750 [Chloroflexota bacterium]